MLGTTRSLIRRACVAAAVVGAWTLRAQADAPAAAAPRESGVTAAPPESGVDAEAGASAPYRASLLREGSHVVRLHGRIARDEATGALSVLVDATDRRRPGHEMILMPSSYLAELEGAIEAAGSSARDRLVEVTGQIFVYRSSNYLLLTHPPVLVESADGSDAAAPVAPERSSESVEPAPAASVTTESAEPSAQDQSADSALDIIRSLEKDVGPVARRPDPPQSLDGATTGLVAPESRLVDRRGKVRRAPRGAFVFTFDADADGLADPPMILLPCLLLERLERNARLRAEEATILLSGQVMSYRAQSYLLPTSLRIPRERTRIESR